jgi:hypothetical protein
MARVTSAKDLLIRNAEDYLKKSTSDWAALFQGTPVFVTYFSKDRMKSTEDQTLDAVMETVGNESPTRYNEIKSFMMWGLEEVQTSIETNELQSPSTTYEGTAVILPDTIRPLPDDYFMMQYGQTSWMFRVVEIQNDRIHGEKYWKLTYQLARISPAQIQSQVHEEFTMLPAKNASVEGKPVVIRRSDAALVELADLILERLVEWYGNYFINKRFNVPLWEMNGIGVYNQALCRFIYRTRALYQPGSYMVSCHVEDVLRWNPAAAHEYETTLFWAAEHERPWDPAVATEAFKLINIPEKTNVFMTHWGQYRLASYALPPSQEPIYPHPGLLDAVISPDLQGEMTLTFKVVALYLRGQLELTDSLLLLLDSYDPPYELETMTLLPVALVAIRRMRDRLAAKQTIA